MAVMKKMQVFCMHPHAKETCLLWDVRKEALFTLGIGLSILTMVGHEAQVQVNPKHIMVLQTGKDTRLCVGTQCTLQ